MKTTSIKLLLCVLVLAVIAGCDKKEKEPEAEITLHNLTELAASDAVTPEGGDFVLRFTSTLSWTVSLGSGSAGWLKVSPVAGNAGETFAVFSTGPNTTGEFRMAEVSISCGGKASRDFVIYQNSNAGEDPEDPEDPDDPENPDDLYVSPTYVDVPYAGGSVSVNILTGMDYQVMIDESWIELLTEETVYEGTLDFFIASNPDNSDRVGTASVVAENGRSVTVTFVQEAAPLEEYFDVSPSLVEVGAEGGQISLAISTNMDYAMKIDPEGWIFLVSGYGVKNGEIVFFVNENQSVNSRAGRIIFTAGGSRHTVQVLQSGIEGGDMPTVTTNIVNFITYTSAVCGGEVVSDGGMEVTARGVIWSTVPEPTVNLSTKTVDGSGLGTFMSTISGLEQNTTYYVRAYATNAAGTSYGEQRVFTTEEKELTGGNEDVGNDDEHKW